MMRTRPTFDPRSKLCTIFFASFILMFAVSFKIEVIFVCLLLLLLVISGGEKKGIILFSLFWLLVLGDYLLFPYVDNGIVAFFDFLFVGNRKMLPTIMASTFATHQTKVSEWICALKKWHLPFSLIVTLTVVCRFFPTFFQDFKSIRNAMKYRGIAVSTWELFTHPIQTMECLVVPILMTAENTSLDLSSAALVRGLGNPGQHTSVYDISFGFQDYLLVFVLGLGCVAGGMSL